jgi:hypothetical protein
MNRSILISVFFNEEIMASTVFIRVQLKLGFLVIQSLSNKSFWSLNDFTKDEFELKTA